MKADPPATIDWRDVAKQSLGRTFWIFVLIAGALAALCYAILGADAFIAAIDRDKEWLFDLLPRVIAAQLAAGFIWVLVPREKMTALVRRNSGRRGLLLAMFAGLITPGGPASAFAFLAILAAAGADRGILVTYITSWALLGMQRVVVWDIPFMGIEFSVLRFLISMPLPIMAGLIARRLPYATVIESESAMTDESR